MIPLPRIQIPRAAVQLRQRIREPVRRCLNGERPLNAAQSDDVGGAEAGKRPASTTVKRKLAAVNPKT